MRRGLLAGIGLAVLATASCGGDEDELDVEIPDTIFTNGSAVVLRTTGVGVTPNNSYVRRALAQMLATEGSFTDFVMRGGLPHEGPVTPEVAGSAPQQLKAYAEGGPFAKGAAVDDCGNPQLAAFVTPAVLQDVFEVPDDQITGLGIWPEACGSDVGCDTSREGQWEIGFSELRGDGHMDLILSLSPIAGSKTQPAFQGHLLAYVLESPHSMPLYANIRQFSISGFGLVRFDRAGISLRPSTMFQPSEIYAFPPEPRELGARDLMVALEGYGGCEDAWKDEFKGEVPFGCDHQKALLLDRTAPLGERIYDEHTEKGTDTSRLDLFTDLFEYQLKTALACPDVTTPRWSRIDVPGGSVELFQCPDGDVDLCLGFHDMEDYFCEWDVPPPPFVSAPDDSEVVARLPVVEGNQTEVGSAVNIPSGGHLTFRYALNGEVFTLQWDALSRTAADSTNPPWPQSLVVDELNRLEQVRAGSGPVQVLFSAGTQGIRVKPAEPLGPLGTLAMGSGDLNATFGLGSGLSADTVAPMLALDTVPHLVTAVAEGANGEPVSYPFDVAYARLNADGLTHLYSAFPDRVLGLYDDAGAELELPLAVPDSHCVADGNVRFDLTDLAAGTYFVALDVTPDGHDELRLLSTSVTLWVP